MTAPDNTSLFQITLKDEAVEKINNLREKNNLPPMTEQSIKKRIEQSLSQSFISTQK